jgi:hypothetical protein
VGSDRWKWGLLALIIGGAVLIIGFSLTLDALPEKSDPGALYAGLTGALSGIVGAYFGVAAGGGAADAVKDAKDGEAKALKTLADVARSVPPGGDDESRAADVRTAMARLTEE